MLSRHLRYINTFPWHTVTNLSQYSYRQLVNNTYGIHLFNKLTKDLPFLTGDNANLAGHLTMGNCPVIYQETEDDGQPETW